MQLKSFFIVASAALILGTTGCTTVRELSKLQTGVSTEADANKLAGKPDYYWHNPDGTRTLEYTNQPLEGQTTYMVTVDASGKVLKVRNVVIDPNDPGIVIGMTIDQVHRILGTARLTQYFPMSGETVWDWNTRMDFGPGTMVRFQAYFKNGALIRTGQQTVASGGID